MTLFTAGFNLYSQDQASAQDAIALKMIEAMQGCIYFHKQAQQPFDSNGVSEQRSAWDKAVAQYHEYMGDLRAQNSHIEQAALADVKMSEQAADGLGMQMNESKFLFARLLDAYIAYLGQVYEKKGFFKNTYYIASNSNPTMSIMPNEYNLLIETLQVAAQQTDWGKTLNLTLPVIAESRLISDKNFNLNEIITAVRNVPLPAGYSTAAILGGVAATAALGAGAYYAYNNMDQLQDSMSDIQAYFNPASQQTEPVVASVVVEEPVVVEPTMLENAQSGFRKGVYGDEAVTVDNWQAGGDAENYGLSGYSGQEALGATLGGVALGAGVEVLAPKTAANQNYQFIADQQKAILGKELAPQAPIKNITPMENAQMAMQHSKEVRNTADATQVAKSNAHESAINAIKDARLTRQATVTEAAEAKIAQQTADAEKILSRDRWTSYQVPQRSSNAQLQEAAQQAKNPASYTGNW